MYASQQAIANSHIKEKHMKDKTGYGSEKHKTTQVENKSKQKAAKNYRFLN